MNPSRRTFLSGCGLASIVGTAALTGFGRRVAAQGLQSPKNLIVVFANGGWDTTYALDPKPGLGSIDAPEGDVQEFGGIPIFTSAQRPTVTSFFEQYASLATVVRGVMVQSINHPDCAKRLLTGTPSDENADVSTLVAHELGMARAIPSLVFGRSSYPGPHGSITARAGALNQIGTLLDPVDGLPIGDPINDPVIPFIPAEGEAELVEQYLTSRGNAEAAVLGGDGRSAQRYQDYVDSLDRARQMREVADFGDLDYAGDLTLQAQIGVSAIEQGLAWSLHLEGGDFDTHSYNLLQAVEHEAFYAGLIALMDLLTTRPGAMPGNKMIDETVVAVMSEMGRTPKLNATMGKDHWPVTSAMFLGAGVGGGRALGATDDMAGSLNVNYQTGEADPDGGKALQYGNLAAALLQACGVDSSNHLQSEPFHALCNG